MRRNPRQNKEAKNPNRIVENLFREEKQGEDTSANDSNALQDRVAGELDYYKSEVMSDLERLEHSIQLCRKDVEKERYSTMEVESMNVVRLSRNLGKLRMLQEMLRDINSIQE